jgi:adenine-specific DNA methylase
VGQYPKRLIEVDLPIKRISAHARREKSIRHGHISTLHIWWARRPLAACRAVICASLWPDPADELCPESFRKSAREQMQNWAQNNLNLSSDDSSKRFIAIQKNIERLKNNIELRKSLLDFIADFANWDNSTVKEYIETSRVLTQSAHEALGGSAGTRPLVVDPFAGGGSIPLEALRVGADAFASDLNPVPVLLNKVLLEYVPMYGQRLADEVRNWAVWIRKEAEKELSEFYPKDPDGGTPIAYLWARTIICEGPSCGAEVPLIRSLWLAKKTKRPVALQLVLRPKEKCVNFKVIVKDRGGWVNQEDTKEKIYDPQFDGTVKRGAATCPCCGYTTPVSRIREQLKARHGGADDSRLMCVLKLSKDGTERNFRLPAKRDIDAVSKAKSELAYRERLHNSHLRLVPDEEISLNEIRRINVPIYGMMRWADVFTPRQKLALTTLTRLISEAGTRVRDQNGLDFAKAVQTGLGCVLSKVLDRNTAVARWEPNVQCSQQVFGRQAIAMVWDFGELAILSNCAGSWLSLLNVWLEGLTNIIEGLSGSQKRNSVTVEAANAAAHPLPDNSADALITDPPYYDAVPYAHLSDFFYVWQRRHLSELFPSIFSTMLAPKEGEIVVDRPHELSTSKKDIAFYERELTRAFIDCRRVLKPEGIGTIVFASKSTASWEAILSAMVEAGWVLTGSWPVDTEMETRMNAMGTATLASSVHIVVRPRKAPDYLVHTDEVGDWRQVLAELPIRIHEWMPRLSKEGVVGADAIFACLGPAIEIFSRYSRVEKASGEKVTLKEFLEQVWAAVAKEALKMIFEGADATGFEEDARLTAMWLWTLKTSEVNEASSVGEESEAEDEDGKIIVKPIGGSVLEYDAARKIAQGLGAHLENLDHLVAIQGETAVLLRVADRSRYLFGKDSAEAPKEVSKKRAKQQTLNFDSNFQEIKKETETWVGELSNKPGRTVLDQLHQSMILFAAGRLEALKRFFVEDGIGRNPLIWRLAQALSALYPPNSDEKRWVDGVLARKKSLGF